MIRTQPFNHATFRVHIHWFEYHGTDAQTQHGRTDVLFTDKLMEAFLHIRAHYRDEMLFGVQAHSLLNSEPASPVETEK